MTLHQIWTNNLEGDQLGDSHLRLVFCFVFGFCMRNHVLSVTYLCSLEVFISQLVWRVFSHWFFKFGGQNRPLFKSVTLVCLEVMK